MCKAAFSFLCILDEGGKEVKREKVQEKQQVYEDELEGLGRKTSFFSTSIVSQLEDACYVCGSGDDEAHLLVCDHCNRRICHTTCAGLTAVPEGDWFCSECAQNRDQDAVQQNSQAEESVDGNYQSNDSSDLGVTRRARLGDHFDVVQEHLRRVRRLTRESHDQHRFPRENEANLLLRGRNLRNTASGGQRRRNLRLDMVESVLSRNTQREHQSLLGTNLQIEAPPRRRRRTKKRGIVARRNQTTDGGKVKRRRRRRKRGVKERGQKRGGRKRLRKCTSFVSESEEEEEGKEDDDEEFKIEENDEGENSDGFEEGYSSEDRESTSAIGDCEASKQETSGSVATRKKARKIAYQEWEHKRSKIETKGRDSCRKKKREKKQLRKEEEKEKKLAHQSQELSKAAPVLNRRIVQS